MVCSFLVMPEGHQTTKHRTKKPCGKKEFKDGFCVSHQPTASSKVAAPAPNYWRLKKDGATVNKKFSEELTSDGKKFLSSDCAGAPDGGGPAGGQSFTGKGGSWSLRHVTRPGMNFTYFYCWTGSEMEVFAIGGHTGSTNKVYSLTWFDGSSATINLSKGTVV